jgi:LysM repeat protein
MSHTPEPTATPVPAETSNDPTTTPEFVASATVVIDSQVTDSLITDSMSAAIAPAAPLSDRPASSLNRSYNIVTNDTLPAIALRFGIDVESLARLNNLERNSPLRAGTSLLLPATDRELRVVSDAQEYVVQPGDSLSAIAKANGVTLAELMTANRIVNPNIVSVGERLEIPGRALIGDRPLQRVGPARSGYYFYTIRSGDTLSELAENLNSTEIALMEYNNISDAATIFNGMELRVPFGAPPLPKRTPPVPLSGSSFLVSLSRQQCWVFSGREVRHAWNCSTGYGQWRTRTGSFAVQSKIEMAKSNVWRLDMPYWLGIYDVGAVENGIHGLPISWRTGKKIWTELIGEPATFGCAMLGDEDALTLFTLAYIGMPVHITQ